MGIKSVGVPREEWQGEKKFFLKLKRLRNFAAVSNYPGQVQGFTRSLTFTY